MHHVGPMHDTALRSTLLWPVGLGLGTMAHAVPFHCSVKLALPEVPTPMHIVTAVHDTPLKNPPLPGSAGVVWRDHVVPSHFIATGAYTPPPKKAWPTAIQPVAPMHETPVR